MSKTFTYDITSADLGYMEIVRTLCKSANIDYIHGVSSVGPSVTINYRDINKLEEEKALWLKTLSNMHI